MFAGEHVKLPHNFMKVFGGLGTIYPVSFQVLKVCTRHAADGTEMPSRALAHLRDCIAAARSLPDQTPSKARRMAAAHVTACLRADLRQEVLAFATMAIVFLLEVLGASMLLNQPSGDNALRINPWTTFGSLVVWLVIAWFVIRTRNSFLTLLLTSATAAMVLILVREIYPRWFLTVVPLVGAAIALVASFLAIRLVTTFCDSPIRSLMRSRPESVVCRVFLEVFSLIRKHPEKWGMLGFRARLAQGLELAAIAVEYSAGNVTSGDLASDRAFRRRGLDFACRIRSQKALLLFPSTQAREELLQTTAKILAGVLQGSFHELPEAPAEATAKGSWLRLALRSLCAALAVTSGVLTLQEVQAPSWIHIALLTPVAAVMVNDPEMRAAVREVLRTIFLRPVS